MNERIELLLRKINDLQDELHLEMAQLADKFRYTIEQRRVIFEHDVAAYHRRLRQNLWQFIRNIHLPILLVSPFIYALIIPLLMLDIFVTVYQTICFPIYGLKKVPREAFIVIDRHYLHYLNIFERFNCAYCGYANGLIAYAREVGARTESYWCPIKHARRIREAHSLYAGFEEYGDAEGYRARLKRLYGERSS